MPCFMFCRQPSALLAFRCFGALYGYLWLLRRWFREVSRDEPLVYLRTLVLCGVRLCRLSCNVYKKKKGGRARVNALPQATNPLHGHLAHRTFQKQVLQGFNRAGSGRGAAEGSAVAVRQSRMARRTVRDPGTPTWQGGMEQCPSKHAAFPWHGREMGTQPCMRPTRPGS